MRRNWRYLVLSFWVLVGWMLAELVFHCRCAVHSHVVRVPFGLRRDGCVAVDVPFAASEIHIVDWSPML